MKSFMKSLVLAAGFALVFSAQAVTDSYLYWMVSEDYNEWAAFAGKNATYAKVKWDNGEKNGYLVNAYDTSSTQFENFTFGQYAAIGSEMLNDSYKFIAEIYNEGGYLGYSNFITGSQLAANGSTGTSVYGITGQTTFTIPEPTSGMLALLGFGLLALRRKQKKA